VVGCASLLAGIAPAQAKLPDYEAGREWAQEILPQLTRQERIGLMATGAGVPRLDVPSLAVVDGPNGIGGDVNSGTTAFPAAIGLAATWDQALARRYGIALAEEATGKGKNLVFAPTINVIRSQLWGRTAETFGEDPFMNGVMGGQEARGMQSRHVIAQIKHYVANDQEQGRFGIPFLAPGTDVLIDEKPLHETYMEPFRIAFGRDGAASVMCSYNSIEGTQACQSPEIMGALRSELGMEGFSGNDSTIAVRDIVAAANAGLDNFVLGSVGGTPATVLARAVRDGDVSTERLDDAVLHILTAMRAVGIADGDAEAEAEVSTKAHRRLATEIGAEGAVLLRNRGHALPLARKRGTIAVIGHNAGPDDQSQEGLSPYVVGSEPITPLEGIEKVAGDRVSYSEGTAGVVPYPPAPEGTLTPSQGSGEGLTGEYYASRDFSGSPLMTRNDPDIDLTGLAELEGAFSIRWTGTYTPTEDGVQRFSIALGGRASVYVDGERLILGDAETDTLPLDRHPIAVYQGEVDLEAGEPVPIRIDYSADPVIPIPPFRARIAFGVMPPDQMIDDAVRTARRADTAVVFANDVSGEGTDRSSMALPGDQDRLIAAVAKANPKTVVVLRTPAAVLTPWRRDVAAIVAGWYPGQQAGKAIARVLFGEVNPSGRLPVTFPRSDRQGPAPGPFPYPENVADHSEGNLVGYRFYEANGQKPAYPFGFGLSYTRFRLGPATVAKSGGGYRVRVPVTNTGERTGAETVQVYVGFPKSAGQPTRQLEGFDKVTVRPGRTGVAKVDIGADVLKVWDPEEDRYVSPRGRYSLWVGTSATDLPQKITVSR